MNTSKIFTTLLIASVIFLGCKQKAAVKGNLKEKKAALQKLLEKQSKTEEEIKQLQNEISLLSGEDASNAKLIAVIAVPVQEFNHYIDLRGKVDAEKK